jgi:hypothetical protein
MGFDPNFHKSFEQMPSETVIVNLEAGKLSIIAKNARLSEILVAVRSKLDADIDIPPLAFDTKLSVLLGPGPARQIVASLLDWTEFNYVIRGRDSEPQGVTTVVLIERGQGSKVSTIEPPVVAQETSPEPEPKESDVAISEPPEQQPLTPASEPEPTGVVGKTDPDAPVEQKPTTASMSTPRTTQGMVEQLQRMYQERLKLGPLAQRQTAKP